VLPEIAEAARVARDRLAANAAAASAAASAVASATPPGARVTSSAPAPTTAAAGSVMSQATRMFPAMPHRTAASRFEPAEPAPSTALDTVCVVDTGNPRCAVV
jgi:hypothetical protein